MPLLMIIGIISVYGIWHVIKDTSKASEPTENENHNMMVEMTGKSRAECKKILRNYKGNWLQR